MVFYVQKNNQKRNSNLVENVPDSAQILLEWLKQTSLSLLIFKMGYFSNQWIYWVYAADEKNNHNFPKGPFRILFLTNISKAHIYLNITYLFLMLKQLIKQQSGWNCNGIDGHCSSKSDTNWSHLIEECPWFIFISMGGVYMTDTVGSSENLRSL